MAQPRVASVNADYIEFQPETLKGFTVSIDYGPHHRFDTIEEAAAWANANADKVMFMSSVDMFIADMQRRTLN